MNSAAEQVLRDATSKDADSDTEFVDAEGNHDLTRPSEWSPRDKEVRIPSSQESVISFVLTNCRLSVGSCAVECSFKSKN